MFKKILAVIIATTAVFAFASCDDASENDENKPVSDVVKPSEEEPEIDYESDLSTERYDGYEFRIFTRKGGAKDQYLEEDSEDLVESATYRRNKLVEEKYGVTITATEASGDFQTDALNSILAGDDAYDLIFTHSRAAFIYAVQGAAYNINDIENIHLEKPWWSKDLQNSCDINGYLYVLDGDITVQGLGCSMAMFFNKAIFDELGFDYPYELVRDGEWTFDEFAYLAKKGGADLNGNGVIEPEFDRFGFASSDWDAPINILYAGGQKIYDKNEEGFLELKLYSNKTVEIFDEFFSLMDNEACYIVPTSGGNVYTGTNHFTSGRAMMYAALLVSSESYRAMDDDFGIIPYPKFDENDEYTTAVNGTAHLGLIPITVTDVERTGAIVEALCAYGSKEVIPAFYEVSLKTKAARDDESEEMMDIIKDSIIYDIGYVSGGRFQSVGRDLFHSNADFASFYAENEGNALKNLEDFNRDYGHQN